MHARIGMLHALNPHVERVFNPERKDPHWGGDAGNWHRIGNCPRLRSWPWSSVFTHIHDQEIEISKRFYLDHST